MTWQHMSIRFALLFAGLLPLPAVCLGAETPPILETAIDHHRNGRFQEALSAYTEAAAELHNTDPANAARAHNNACVILLNTAEYEAALGECESALELRRELGDEVALARTLNNLAIIHQNLGSYEEAEEFFHRALEINSNRDDAQAQVFNYSNLGSLAVLTGQYGQALSYHRQADALAGEHHEESWSATQRAVAAMNQGVVLEKIGAYREALEHYQRALELGASGGPRLLGRLHVNLGVAYRNLGDPVRAIEEYTRAVALLEQAQDRAGLTQAKLNLGLAYHLNLAQPAEAATAYQGAAELAVEISDRRLEIETSYYLGRFLLQQGELDAAQIELERCLQGSDESGSSEGRWSALDGLAEIAVLNGDLDQAREMLTSALAEIDQARGELEEPELRASYFGEKRGVYKRAVQVLADMHRDTPQADFDLEAYDLVQRAKARSLLDVLGPDVQAVAATDRAQIQAALSHSLLLEYFVADQDALLWIVGPEQLRMVNLGPAEAVLDSVASVYQQLAEGELPDPELISSLSAWLLGEAAEDLGDTDEAQIAPDLGLNYLPFEILPDPNTPTGILVESVSINYIPSGSILATGSAVSPLAETAAVGFAASGARPSRPEGTEATSAVAQAFQLEPLPATRLDLSALHNHLPSPQHQFIGSDATKEALWRTFEQGARVLHLAAHTVIDERRGGGTSIVLTPGASDDGLLRPSELSSHSTDVSLTVLAACRSAVQPGRESGALTTMTGSLLAAGSAAVLATLWDVDDQSTAIFMDQFYYQLGRGLTASQALRKAKLQFLRDVRWQDTVAWAPYVLVGDSQPFAARRGRWWIPGLAVLGAIMLLAVWLRRR